MTIGKVTKGKGFRGVIDYLFDDDKSPRIISTCMFGSTPAELAREFRMVANLRQSVGKPVRHFSVSFAPEDGAVDDVIKEAIVFRVLDGLGYNDCQFVAIDHDRDDPGHDRVHDHDHLHIITNAVSVLGDYVRDSFDHFKIQAILREAERDFGLRQISSCWEVRKRKAQAVNLDLKITQTIASTLEDRPNLAIWLDRLSTHSIDVRFNLSHRDNVAGITFIQNRQIHKGSDIGWKWSVVKERLDLQPDDLSLMVEVNRQTQAKSVRLNKLDRAMFDRVIEMARVKLGNTKKFENCRVEIKLEGNVLTVLRIRPNKLMVRAIERAGQWEPVGFPNIDRKDVELLERMNKAKAIDFESLAIDRNTSVLDEEAKHKSKTIVSCTPNSNYVERKRKSSHQELSA
jgi:hypothetical protein